MTLFLDPFDAFRRWHSDRTTRAAARLAGVACPNCRQAKPSGLRLCGACANEDQCAP